MTCPSRHDFKHDREVETAGRKLIWGERRTRKEGKTTPSIKSTEGGKKRNNSARRNLVGESVGGFSRTSSQNRRKWGKRYQPRYTGK